MIVYDRVVNTMHLVDIGCKACGSRGPFNIELMCLATVMDGWIDHGIGTDTWSLDAKCVCTRCGRAGVVGDFTTDGLDERLAAGATVEARIT
jgi:hypothetical protein